MIPENEPNEGFDYKRLRLVEVACDLCGSTDHSELFIGDRYNMGLRTVICKQCALIFTNPRPATSVLREFYKHHYREFYESASYPNAEYLKKGEFSFRAEVVFAHLEPYFERFENDKSVRVLDVGCSEGSVLRKLTEEFPGAIDAFGVEPSLSFSEFARAYSGATIFTGTLDEFFARPEYPQSFDLIVVNHVLEHVENPSNFLAQLHDRLSTNGILFVEIPNIMGNWSGTSMIHMAHLYQFSEHTLRLLFSKVGFDPLIISLEGNHLHPWAMASVAKKGARLNALPFNEKLVRSHAEAVKAKFYDGPHQLNRITRFSRLMRNLVKRIAR